MSKNRKAVTCNGRAAFYAAMWNDIRQYVMDNGWAVNFWDKPKSKNTKIIPM